MVDIFKNYPSSFLFFLIEPTLKYWKYYVAGKRKLQEYSYLDWFEKVWKYKSDVWCLLQLRTVYGFFSQCH